MQPKKEGLGVRIRAARKGRGWSQGQLALKAGVGGANQAGRIKSIQRIERDEVESVDVLKKVLQALGFEEEEVSAALPSSESSSRRADGERTSLRRRRRRVVVDGQQCLKALLSLPWEGMRRCDLALERDLVDDDGVDEVLLKVCGWVDRVRRIGNAYRQNVQGHLGTPIPNLSCTEEYEAARDIRKAVHVLRRHGFRLELADELIEFQDSYETFLTRTFYVSPVDAPKVDHATA